MKSIRKLCLAWVVVGSLVVVVGGFLFFAVPSQAADRSTKSSGLLSGSAVVSKYPCLLTDIAAYANGSAGATIILYDNNVASATGTILYKVVLSTTSLSGGATIPTPIKATKGIYMTLSGTGAGTIIFTTPE